MLRNIYDRFELESETFLDIRCLSVKQFKYNANTILRSILYVKLSVVSFATIN